VHNASARLAANIRHHAMGYVYRWELTERVVAAPPTELMRIRTKMAKLAGEFAPVGQEKLHALFD
jgi:hypothetical protein